MTELTALAASATAEKAGFESFDDSVQEAVTQEPENRPTDITESDITTKQQVVIDGKTVTQHVITAPNPSPEEMEKLLANIKVNYDNKVITKPIQFNFHKSTDKDTGIEIVRQAVQIPVIYPSVEGIIAILETGGKQLELLQEAIEKVVNDAVRALLYEDVTYNAATFPIGKVSWEKISNQPKAQRRGGGIPKETWEGFGEDYINVMPEVTGKNIEHVANAAKILVNKFAQAKTNVPVLELLVGQLAVYAENSPNIADYQECVEFLLTKAETFLNVSDEELLANL